MRSRALPVAAGLVACLVLIALAVPPWDASGAAAPEPYISPGSTQPQNWFEHARTLLPPDPTGGAQFGASVAMNDRWVVVGAPYAQVGNIQTAGVVYVFDRADWSITTLQATEVSTGTTFGQAVAISGNDIVVGAPYNQCPGGFCPGAAYVFRWVIGTVWEVRPLVNPAAVSGDRFGSAVAIEADFAVVGAYNYDSDGQDGSGLVQIFMRNAGAPGQWGWFESLYPPAPFCGEGFGTSVAIRGPTLAVGAPVFSACALPPIPPARAEVFNLNGGAFVYSATLLSTLPYTDGMGASVAVLPDTIFAGAYKRGGLTAAQGAGYFFDRDAGCPGCWGRVSTVTADPLAGQDYLGSAAAIEGQTAVVGAPRYDNYRGAAYVFRTATWNPSSWLPMAALVSPEPADGAFFGYSVATSVGVIAVGAPGVGSGSVYIYEERTGDPPGTATPTQTSTPTRTQTPTTTPTRTPTQTPTTTPTRTPTTTPTPTKTPISGGWPPPKATVVGPSGGLVTYVATTTTTLNFPPGAVGEPVTVTIGLTDTLAITATFGALGEAFYVEVRDGAGNPVTGFAQPFTITIEYSDADVAGLDEAALKLYWWDAAAGAWVEVPCVVDTAANTLTAVLDHLTVFAALAPRRWQAYLPMVMRN